MKNKKYMRPHPVASYNESARGFISGRPAFVIRWALPFFLLFVSSVVTAVWRIHYPEIIKGKVVLGNITFLRDSLEAVINAPDQFVRKITDGQNATLRFDADPYNRSGLLPGKIYVKDKGPQERTYTIHISWAEGQQHYRQDLASQSDGQGAEIFIVIEDMRLVQRLFHRSASSVN